MLKTVKIPVRKYSVLTDPQELERRRNVVVEGNGPPPMMSSYHDNQPPTGPDAYLNTSDEDVYNAPNKGISAGDGADCTGDDGDGADCADDENGGDSDDAPVSMDISIQSALKWKHTRTALLSRFDDNLKRLRDEVSTMHNNSTNLSQCGGVALTLHPPHTLPSADATILDRVLNVEAGWKVLSDCDWRLVFIGATFFIVSLSIVVILLFFKSRH